jgi:nickel-dependent lactate racemase
MIIGKGYSDRCLTNDEVREIVSQAVASLAVDGKRVLVIIPDGTRTMPMPLMFGLFQELLSPRVKALDYLVALGTHAPMSDAQLSKLVGQTVVNGQAGRSHIVNHEWSNPSSLVEVGVIPADEIRQITDGLMAHAVPVRLNKLVLDYDQLIICGPVFPHEAAGFSGGNKYFFPGIAGPDIINFIHWLGAVITNYKVVGAHHPPTRAIIDRAAAFVNCPTVCFALVVVAEGLAGVYFGTPQEAWQAAVPLSAEKYIIYVDKPFRQVWSVMPEMYDDLWTGAKGMLKVEPAVADGGEVIIYAPHITEISYTHGKLIDQIGYHCRDYFLAQWTKFKGYPGAVLSHSTLINGLGQYDAATGIETHRVRVTLATRIPEERCRRLNIGYLDPASVNLRDLQGREDEGILVVPRAGEMLYRVK